MRLHSLQSHESPRVAPAWRAPSAVAPRGTTAGASPAPAGAAATAAAEAAAWSVTATWQWSFSLQISLSVATASGAPGGAEAAPATTDAATADARVGEREPGRRHVAQALGRLAKAVRHELKAMIAANPDLDPEVRHALREIGRDFRHELREAFVAAGRGADFDAAKLLAGVQDALLALADSLGKLIGEEEVPPTEQTPPAETPPAADVRPEPAPDATAEATA